MYNNAEEEGLALLRNVRGGAIHVDDRVVPTFHATPVFLARLT